MNTMVGCTHYDHHRTSNSLFDDKNCLSNAIGLNSKRKGDWICLRLRSTLSKNRKWIFATKNFVFDIFSLWYNIHKSNEICSMMRASMHFLFWQICWIFIGSPFTWKSHQKFILFMLFAYRSRSANWIEWEDYSQCVGLCEVRIKLL